MPTHVLCYGGTAATEVNAVAEAVSLHINFLGTGKGDVELDAVRAIIVEDADRAVLSQSRDFYEQFEQLHSVNAVLASDLRRKLLHQKILARVISQVFHKVKAKIDVIGRRYYDGQLDTIFIDIKPILDTKNDYAENLAKSISETFKGDAFHLEKRFKPIIEQAVEPRFDDLSLSQAQLGADLKGNFDAAETKRSDMEKRLLDAIIKLKP